MAMMWVMVILLLLVVSVSVGFLVSMVLLYGFFHFTVFFVMVGTAALLMLFWLSVGNIS